MSLQSLAATYVEIVDRAHEAGESPAVQALLANRLQLDICRRELEIADRERDNVSLRSFE